jgi:hypothetical protein
MQRTIFILVVLLFCIWFGSAEGHEVRPGYLELREESPGRYEVLWKRPARGEVLIELDPVFPEACTFNGPGKLETTPGAMLTRATMTCKNGLQGKTIRIAGLESTMTDVLIRVYHADGAMETHMLRPVSPTATIGAAGSSGQRAVAYLRLGIEHILMGVDHLLFVLGLLLIVSSRMMLVKYSKI